MLGKTWLFFDETQLYYSLLCSSVFMSTKAPVMGLFHIY